MTRTNKLLLLGGAAVGLYLLFWRKAPAMPLSPKRPPFQPQYDGGPQAPGSMP